MISPKGTCSTLLRPLGKSHPHLLSRIKKVTDLKALVSWKCLRKMKLRLQSQL